MKKYILIIAFLGSVNLSAQDCKVMDSGVTLYKGDCKKGMAHGDGIATLDGLKVEGSFKKGFLNGDFTINYDNGDIFKGEAKDGEVYGFGVMEYANNDPKVEGYWKGEIQAFNMVGKDEQSLKGYRILTKDGLDGAKIRMVKNSNEGKKINIKILDLVNKQISSLSLNERSSGEVRKPQVVSGGIITQLNNVVFPYIGAIRYNKLNATANFQIPVIFKFEILEEGSWSIDITHQ